MTPRPPKPFGGAERITGELVAARLREFLEGVGFVKLVRIDQDATGTGPTADLVVIVDTPAGQRRLILELKGDGLPRTLARAAETLRSRLNAMPDTYGMIAAPYITERGMAVCRRLGVGCIDAVGNGLITLGEILYINRSGIPNPAPDRRRQRSLFTPRITRVLRVLLQGPQRRWYVRDLATEAGVVMSAVSRAKHLLRDQDLLGEDRREFWLGKPDELLQEWASAYSYEVNEVNEFYSILDIAQAEAEIGRECEARGIRYGLTLFSGAGRVAPFVRYNRASAFVAGRVEAVADSLGLKRVPSGANVILLRPYDEGVFYGLQIVEGVKVVSDVQLYLDLKAYKARGEEAADFLYERRIKPRWHPEPGATTPPEP